MITGAISRRRAYLNLTVRGPGGQEGEVEFVLDTGFTGVITLPPSACNLLALPYVRPQPAGLADGSRIMLDVYEATLLWDGVPRAVAERVALMDRREAFNRVHFPRAGESFAQLQSARTPGHLRLIFEELFFLEVGLELKRKRLRARPGISFKLDERVRAAIKNRRADHRAQPRRRGSPPGRARLCRCSRAGRLAHPPRCSGDGRSA